jgi:PBP1b-binding outer membrane lipoprotein LpoB
MKRIIFLLSLACLIASCSTTKRVSETSPNQSSTSVSTEKDGSSFEKAIVINEKNAMSGVNAEYAWIKQKYPGSKIKGQYLVKHKDQPYDVIEIITTDGKEKSIFFNISNFFGKF